jgi:hypothetical protein
MNEYDVKRFILAQAIVAEIDAMKVFNALSAYEQKPPYYSADHFEGKAEDLRQLADLHNEQL